MIIDIIEDVEKAKEEAIFALYCEMGEWRKWVAHTGDALRWMKGD